MQWKRKEKREEKKRNERKIYSTKIIRQKTREGEFANTSSSWGAACSPHVLDNELEMVVVLVVEGFTIDVYLEVRGGSVKDRVGEAAIGVFAVRNEPLLNIIFPGFFPTNEAVIRAEHEVVLRSDKEGSNIRVVDEINVKGLGSLGVDLDGGGRGSHEGKGEGSVHLILF